jgi:hypothetical protein
MEAKADIDTDVDAMPSDDDGDDPIDVTYFLNNRLRLCLVFACLSWSLLLLRLVETETEPEPLSCPVILLYSLLTCFGCLVSSTMGKKSNKGKQAGGSRSCHLSCDSCDMSCAGGSRSCHLSCDSCDMSCDLSCDISSSEGTPQEADVSSEEGLGEWGKG